LTHRNRLLPTTADQSCWLGAGWRNFTASESVQNLSKALFFMVGGTRFELVTPTMST